MRRKRQARAKNKIQDSLEGALVKSDQSEPQPGHFSEAPAAAAVRTTAVALRRSGLFNAELEEAIDIIARERVYRAMLASLGRRLLAAPLSIEFEEPMEP